MVGRGLAARVLECVRLIPRGQVMTYGDVAELMGEGAARGVGSVLARWGSETHWWRVLRADGTPAMPHDGVALALLNADQAPMLVDGDRVDMSRARWNGR